MNPLKFSGLSFNSSKGVEATFAAISQIAINTMQETSTIEIISSFRDAFVDLEFVIFSLIAGLLSRRPEPYSLSLPKSTMRRVRRII